MNESFIILLKLLSVFSVIWTYGFLIFTCFYDVFIKNIKIKICNVIFFLLMFLSVIHIIGLVVITLNISNFIKIK